MSWKKPLLIGAWSLTALAWLSQVPVLLLVSEKKLLLLSLGGAAVITELALYATAGLLGLTIVESRQRIWSTIKQIVGFEPKSTKSIE